MKCFYLLSFFFLCLLPGLSHSQSDQSDGEVFSLHVDSASFHTVVERIEAMSSYYFFYKESDFDTLKFSVHADQKSLKAILNEVFLDSPFRYSIDEAGHVFVTMEREIVTTLPLGFLTQETSNEDDVPAEDVFKYMQGGKENKVLAEAEAKLYEIGRKTTQELTGKANLAGYVKDIDTGEPVIGAVVFVENPRIGVATDQFGYYSLTLPRGRHELKIASVGMKSTKRQIALYSDGKLNVELKEDVVPLREIIVESEKDVNVTGLQMGVEKLDIKALRQVPTAFGETDILKVALTLPGVQTVGESSTGLNVRGGSTDQNLILFNDAVIYNPSHLFGFFSAFNPDMLKNVELYKSGVPASHGGRISSVLEITSREGNKKKFVGAGGIGLLTSRLSFEGPIIKDKFSFVLGGRTTYSDWLLRQIPNETFRNSKASFHDLNLHLHYDVNDKNSIFVSGYYSRDRFKLNSDTLFGYQNQAASIKWKHIFQNKLYGVFTASSSSYSYDVESTRNPVNAFEMDYSINQYTGKADFNYFPISSLNIDFGLSSAYYKLHPGSFQPAGEESLILPELLQDEQGLESAVYVGGKLEVNSRLSVYAGIRYSMYNTLGPREVVNYAPNLPREEQNVLDTTQHGGGIVNTYHGPEYRASLRYLLGREFSVKLGYNRMRQYIHMLSNTTTMSPTDIWKLSDPHIQPQIGDQYSIGLYKNFVTRDVETSVEAYYKDITNFLDFKSGAQLILNPAIETDVISTEGKAYGLEFMVKKQKGKINGWVSYTYSRSLLRTPSQFDSEIINGGAYYPSNYDKPHDFTLVGNYRFNRRFSISYNFTYSTGRPITIPLLKYNFEGVQRLHYSDRNQFRIPDYYRSDLAFNIEGNHKVRKLAHSSWTIAVYNLFGRKNAYSVYFVSDEGTVKGYQLSIFGNPIPTLTYNFRF